MSSRPGYIPTLDGWRAFAIFAVFFAHMHRLAIPGHYGPKVAALLGENGGRGVDIFFAISGLLICTRLLDEEQRLGRISVKAFYLRRAFRILPPAIFFLFVLLLLHLYGPIELSTKDWLASLFLFRNYTITLAGPPLSWWFTSHFWSLSVEEHFYLVLPAVLVLLSRWRLRVLIGLSLMSFAWKLSVKYFLHLPPDTTVLWLFYHSEACCDALLIPAAVAVYQHGAAGKRQLSRLLQSRTTLLIGVPLAALVFYRFGLWPMGRLAAPLLILATVYNPDSMPGRFLEWRPLRWIGRLSYSLYLWQMLFFCTRLTTHTPLGPIQTFPWNVFCLVAVATFSYYCIEQPMIRLGHRLTRSSYVAAPVPLGSEVA